MLVPENAAPLLAQTLRGLVGAGKPGSMAFVRCLPNEVVEALARDERFAVPGWQIAAVSATEDPGARTIPADRAVEWREEKREAVLLMVDTGTAGAGMDGIYSAAREIKERELFDGACDLAREKLPHGSKGFATKALHKARRLARNQALSPWREFTYLCRAVTQSGGPGSALGEIGLWPIALGDKLDDQDLDRSALLVERLLPRQGARQSPEERVVALKLPAADANTQRALADFLRQSERLPTRLEALRELGTNDSLWLNRLRPGLFDEQTLQSIRWVNWRGKSKRPLAWSGLVADADNRLMLYLNPSGDNPKDRARMEIRWLAEPEALARGVVDYVIEVRAGNDVLAEKTVAHAAKSPQKCVFIQDDFGELEEDSRFEAQVVIRALVPGANESDESPFRAVSEDFILCFGDTEKPAKSSAGSVFPTLALAAIHVAPDAETFDRLASIPGDKQAFSRDAKGFITCRVDAKAARVLCPKLLLSLATDWLIRDSVPGRWRLAVRADGTPVGEPQFVRIDPGADPSGRRFSDASRAFARWLATTSLGPLAVLYTDQNLVADYVNAAIAWWESAPAEVALIHTLEVVSPSERGIGLIVLPTHPLRVAWQQAFDMLARRHRYDEGAPPAKVAKLMGALCGAHYPALLPGFRPGKAFVFADSLGFHAVAMTSADDPEPRATVALLSRLLVAADNVDEELVAPSVGKSAAELLGHEIATYLNLHPEYRKVRLHALQPGDAMPAARALGCALKAGESREEESEETPAETEKRAFELELYPAEPGRMLAGRFLSATAERRRSGAGMVPEEDRWLLESVARPGGVTLPRLAWTRRATRVPETAAHLALAFDIFSTSLECRPTKSLTGSGSLEAHGLALTPERNFFADPIPHWLSVIPPSPDGEKHPVGRAYSDRLVKAHTTLLRRVVGHLGGGSDDWPALVTEVTPDQGEALASLHRLCDWVITVDRHAGVEYFDSPRELPRLYEAYLIDCVPERDDLGFLQLITSTSSFDEITRLLDAALGEMGLSASPRNCAFILGALKAVSGRLALRLANTGTVAQEMIAIALTQHHCANTEGGTGPWLSLKDGFFVPLDDVPELFRAIGERIAEDERRADLLYVSVGKRGGLMFGFVEVKFRRYLKTARATELTEAITQQLDASCERWEKLFGPDTTPLEKTLQRARLVRVLRFYARKGRRHELSAEAFERIGKELERLAREGTSYALPVLTEQERPRVGFIFCPEYSGAAPSRVAHDGDAEIWLFGPSVLPEPRQNQPAALEISTQLPSEDATQALAAPCDQTSSQSPSLESFGAADADLFLGYRDPGEERVTWRVTTKGNPHLLIVGLPGMGKTTCLIQLCKQLWEARVAPIVFSYHQDIDEQLERIFGTTLQRVSYAGLGFNPMQVVGDGPLAYVDNVAMLRDIFAAIFPDLGDVQLGRLREALKQSYVDCGWTTGVRGSLPQFRVFYELLRNDPRPDKGLMTRLSELADYGLFDSSSGAPSLLDSAVPALVQIHSSQNEMLQRAFATFVLHNLYQAMFRRGPQPGIAHAIIFDEAHRAAKLKLLPTMAKECRKYGLALVVASQEVKDFDSSLFMAIANYLTLRVNEADAKLMAKLFSPSDKVTLFTDRIKQMPKYKALFYGEGMQTPQKVALASLNT